MKNVQLIPRVAALAAAASLSFVALATDYTWKTGGKSGNWSDPAMWTGGDGTDYPRTLDDTASFPQSADETVTLTEDISIGTLGKTSGFSYAKVVFELGGHTLTVKNSSDVYFLCSEPMTKDMTPYRQPVFKNGTFAFASDSKGVSIGMNGQKVAGGFTLDDCVSNFKLSSAVYTFGPPRIIVKNGGVWNFSGWAFYQYNQISAGVKGGFLQVTGEGSILNMNVDSRRSMVVNGTEGGLYVQDGAQANIAGTLAIGGSDYVGEHQNFSSNSFVEVENATLSVASHLMFGGYDDYAITEHNIQYGPTFTVKGKASVTIGGSIRIYDEIAAKLEFVPRSAGWKTAPVTAKSLVLVARNANYAHHAPTTNFVHAAGWAVKSGTTIPLLELTTANVTDLATLVERTVIDYDTTLFPAPPTVSVSADGKSLLLTAPNGVQESLLVPELTASCEIVGLTSERVSLNFATFGRNCLYLDSAKVSVYDNAACEGTPVAENALDVSTMTNPAGTYSTVLTGLDLSQTCWAKAVVTNDCGVSATAIVKIDEDLLAPPAYTVSREVASLTSERVTITFTSFGCVVATVSEAKVYLYDNPSCTGEPVEVKTLDAAAITDPQGTYSTLFEGLDARVVYGVKVVVKNSAGSQTEKTIDFASPGATGQTFFWHTDEGDFESAANWVGQKEVAVSSYPTTNDIISIDRSGAVVRLQYDETVSKIDTIGSAVDPVIDLNGHALTMTSSDSTLLVNYNYATEENLETFLPTLTLKNGTIGKNLMFLFYNGSSPGTGCAVFDNCRYVGGLLLYQARNGFRIFIQNGSYVQMSSEGIGSDFCWSHDAAYSGYGFICVRGKGSYFTTTYDNGGSSRFCLNDNHNGLYVLDGAAATMTMSTCIGGGNYSTNNFVEVDNATLTNKYNLAFGYYNNWSTWVEVGAVVNPQLRIKGANARVLVGTDLRILNGIGAEIRYTMPAEGFATTPLTAKTMTLLEPTKGQSDGPARLVVDARSWKQAHPLETATLLTLETANASALQSLVDNASVRGHCTLAVTADGKSVTVTAPARRNAVILVIR